MKEIHDTSIKILRPAGPRNPLTGSAKALSQRTVAVALLSWLPWTITTTGRDRVWKDTGGGLSTHRLHPQATPTSPTFFPFFFFYHNTFISPQVAVNVTLGYRIWMAPGIIRLFHIGTIIEILDKLKETLPKISEGRSKFSKLHGEQESKKRMWRHIWVWERKASNKCLKLTTTITQVLLIHFLPTSPAISVCSFVREAKRCSSKGEVSHFLFINNQKEDTMRSKQFFGDIKYTHSHTHAHNRGRALPWLEKPAHFHQHWTVIQTGL